MDLIPTAAEEHSITNDAIARSLAEFGRTPLQQSDYNLDQAIRVLEYLPARGGACLAIREIRDAKLLLNYRDRINAIDDVIAIVEGTAIVPCGFIPHPLVVARAELQNAQRYLRTAA